LGLRGNFGKYRERESLLDWLFLRHAETPFFRK
jgi:hypothetical protein